MKPFRITLQKGKMARNKITEWKLISSSVHSLSCNIPSPVTGPERGIVAQGHPQSCNDVHSYYTMQKWAQSLFLGTADCGTNKPLHPHTYHKDTSTWLPAIVANLATAELKPAVFFSCDNSS